jgi:tetratricopeptide (TPR) repeat protein
MPNEPLPIEAFVAEWDESLGPKLVQFYPESSNSDYESYAIQFFMTFETVFGSSSDKGFKKTEITLPIAALERTALINLDVIENTQVRGGLLPFILVLMIPERFPSEKNLNFKPAIEKTIKDYKNVRSANLKILVDECLDVYNKWRYLEEEEKFNIDSYSLTTAVNDFKSAIAFFQSKNFENAYNLLKKAFRKFEADKNTKLLLECAYLLATIELTLKRYEKAIGYFDQVIPLATEVQHTKYLEIAQFMTGFCNYKIEKFEDAIIQLRKLNPETSTNINKIQFHTILARCLMKVGNLDEALTNLNQALQIIEKQPSTDALKAQKAQIFYDLSIIQYQKATNILRVKGFSAKEEYDSQLLQAIKNLQNSYEIWQLLNDYNHAISCLKLMGNLYEVFGNLEKTLDCYLLALKTIEAKNDMGNKVKITSRIIQIQARLNKWEDVIKIIEDILFHISDYAFIDLLTLANLHKELGNARWKLGQDKFAVAELITALNSLKKLQHFHYEQLDIIQLIIDIYQKSHDKEKVEYYKEEMEQIKRKIETLPSTKKLKKSLLGPIKEIWVYSIHGIELFSYSPESRMDVDLLGGFFTAIQQFGMELSKKQVKEIILGDERYSIFKEENDSFYIVGRSSVKYTTQEVEKSLEKIYIRFYKEYSNALDNFVGDVVPFKSFRNIIEAGEFC